LYVFDRPISFGYSVEVPIKTKDMNTQDCDCDNGVRYVANGQDDFDSVYCDCKAGEKLAFLAWFKDAKKALVKKMTYV